MDDNEILDLYFARSEQAIVQTDQKYGFYCYSIAKRILSDPLDAEESVNDTYYSAWKLIPPRRPQRFSTFLGKITRNLAINRLRESDAKSKVIILLTDGVNNHGEIAPLTAAEIAKAQGIRVYTIGVGTEGMAPYPAIDMFGNLTFVNQKVEIDEKVLKAISDMTGGRYFRATDKEKLKAVYDEINQLEKSKIEVMEHISYHELFLTWALAALGLLFAEFLLSNLVLKRIP